MQQVPILALDIEGFTDPKRGLPHRRAMLGRLEALLTETARFFIPYGNPLDILAYQGTGDGWYLIFQHFSFHIAFKYALDLSAALTAQNQVEADATMRIRLRQVLAVGDVENVGTQYLTDVFSEAARFLDHPPFKHYLQDSGEATVIALSALFYSEWQRSPDYLDGQLPVVVPPCTPFRFADKYGLFHDGFALGAGWVEPEDKKQVKLKFPSHSEKRLRQIQIKGFKSIADAEIILNDLNVIIGANGAGKSNLVGAFRLLERLLSKRLQGYAKTEPDRFFYHGKKVTETLSFDCIFDYYSYGCTLGSTRDNLIFEREWVKYNDHPGFGDLLGTSHLESKLEEAAHSHRSQISKYVFQKMPKPMIYHFNDASDFAPVKENCYIDDNHFFRTDAANLPAYLYLLQKKHPVPFRHIEEHIRLIMPFFDRFVLAPLEENKKRIKLKWRQKGSDAYFDADSLSDGTLRFICLATLLLQPEPPALILLDEPELGLHPSAICILAEMLEMASHHVQVVLATQSVTLLEYFKAQDVIVAENNGQATTFQRLDEEKLKHWLEEFSIGELWERNIIGGRP